MYIKQVSFYTLKLLFTLFVLSSCRNHSIMFRTDKSIGTDKELNLVSSNYQIIPGDILHVSVYTNNGERLIDPNYELHLSGEHVTKKELLPQYIVKGNGNVLLPMIGEVQLAGYTIFEADSLLSLKYAVFYEDVFVLTEILSKRVTVLGPAGGKTILLTQENMNLIEVVGQYGGITEFGNASNIRLIRGSLNDPTVYLIDLSTVEGMTQAMLTVKPQDIIYIERRKKTFIEVAREISPSIAILTNIIALLVVLSR